MYPSLNQAGFIFYATSYFQCCVYLNIFSSSFFQTKLLSILSQKFDLKNNLKKRNETIHYSMYVGYKIKSGEYLTFLSFYFIIISTQLFEKEKDRIINFADTETYRYCNEVGVEMSAC